MAKEKIVRRFIPKSIVLLLFCAAVPVAASAQNFAVESFNPAVGGNPVAGPLVQGFTGHLYGTASAGGSSSNCRSGSGCGTVFEVSPTGELSALYDFCSQKNCADGSDPQAGLILAADGDFYGTTLTGGANGVIGGLGFTGGTVFKISPSGELTTLHSFCSQVTLFGVCVDGATPFGLVQAADGNIYGMTALGGNAPQLAPICYNPDANLYGCGTIFKITTSGKFATVYAFCPQLNSDQICPDGQGPQTALVQGRDGNLYGTTPFGGANVCDGFGCGTIFRITPTGNLSTIYNFCPGQGVCVDGLQPGSLLPASNGSLYGITAYGSPLRGGSIFELTKSGKLKTLYGFCSVNIDGGPCPGGSFPASLMQATDGNFYGTTSEGGATCIENGSYGCGTVFQMTPAGNVTVLHSLCVANCNDGRVPSATLAQATDGDLVGLVAYAGANKGCIAGCGTIFRLSTGMGPFVEANPSFGKAGSVVAIMGNNLTSP